MSLRSKLLVFSTFALQLVLGASVAEAQGWLADRSRAEGPGFRLGNFELHPGLGAEVGYDSNVFLSDDANRPERSSGILRITPHLFLSTIGPQRLEEARDGGEVALPTFDLRTGLSGSLYHYLASNAGNSNMSADADVAATILPERPFSVTVSGNFSRTIQPFTEAGAIGNDYARDQASAGARFQLQTKGGVLKGTAGYRFGADLFEGATFRFADNFDHTITTTSAWRFLPNTALLWDGQLILQNYENDGNATNAVLLSDNYRVRSRVGLNGAITQTISLLVMAGYGAGFFDQLDDYDSLVAQAQLTFAFSRALRASLGYDRDFQRSYVGGHYRRDRGNLKLDLTVAGVWLIGVEGGVGLYDFGRILGPGGTAVGEEGARDTFERDDIRVDAELFTEYRLASWFAINAKVQYMANFTDFQFKVGTAAPDPADYSRFTIWGGARVFY